MPAAQTKNIVRVAQSRTFASIIDRWPVMLDLARDLGISYYTVAAWRRRDSIPPGRWDAVVQAGRARGMRLSYEALRAIYATRWPQLISLPSRPFPDALPCHPRPPATTPPVNVRTPPENAIHDAHCAARPTRKSVKERKPKHAAR